MSRWRSSMVLLGICVVAIVVGFLRVLTEPTPPPPGSSYSAEPDGALALYTWLQAMGGQPQRLTQPGGSVSSGTLLILEPATPIERAIVDGVADRGGTIVLAGGGIPWISSARALGITVEPASPVARVATSDGLSVRFSGRFRVGADGAQPLLVRPDGASAGVRLAYHAGTLIVVASSEPFSNAGLADPDTARFVFRTVVDRVESQPVHFDEIERAVGPAPAETNLNQLVFGTPPGRAVMYLAALTFIFLLLTGRRLGPAVAAVSADASERTMYEHVQMLANLYRRAGQLEAVRTALGRHYAHRPAQARHPEVVAEALARLRSARTESDLISAVNAIDDAG